MSSLTDDGTGPEKIAHIMGPPDQCQHAASIITDLLQSIRAREEGGQGVGVLNSISVDLSLCAGALLGTVKANIRPVSSTGTARWRDVPWWAGTR